MSMLDKLFKFPTIAVDSRNEENRENRKVLGLPDEDETDYIIVESEYLWFDFIGIGDRWLPTKESFERARNGNFEACTVTINNIGTLLVPWNKEKFKAKFKKFVDTLMPEPEKNITFLLTNKDEFKNFAGEEDNNNNIEIK